MAPIRDLAGSTPIGITERCRRKRGHVTAILLTDAAGWWNILQVISDHGHVWMGQARPLSNDEVGIHGWALMVWDGEPQAIHLEGNGALTDLLERLAIAMTEREAPGSSQAG